MVKKKLKFQKFTKLKKKTTDPKIYKIKKKSTDSKNLKKKSLKKSKNQLLAIKQNNVLPYD